MSLCCPFVLPTAGVLSFSQIRTIEYRQLISDADACRARVRDILKRAKRADNPDVFSVINAIESYIPYLFSISQAVDSRLFEEPLPLFTASWRLSMRIALNSSAKSAIIEPPKVEISNLKYEIGMTLFTYALALIATAESSLADSSTISASTVELYGAGPDKPSNPAVDKWKHISTCLLKADSIFRYLLEQNFSRSSPELARVMDLSPTALNAMTTLMSGSIHLATIYKTQEQQSTSSSTLYSRVAIYAAERFSTAYQMFASINTYSGQLSSAGASSDTQKKRFQISTNSIKTHMSSNNSPMLTWLEAAQKYCIASAEVFMAQASYSKNEVGLAVGYLLNAKKSVQSIESKRFSFRHSLTPSSTSGLSGGNNNGGSGFKLKETIDHLLKNYQAENDRIAFQPIPEFDEMKAKWPSGREVVQSQSAWIPPPTLLTFSGADDEYFSTAAGGNASSNRSYEPKQGYY